MSTGPYGSYWQGVAVREAATCGQRGELIPCYGGSGPKTVEVRAESHHATNACDDALALRTVEVGWALVSTSPVSRSFYT
jgi:hypothetical protein